MRQPDQLPPIPPTLRPEQAAPARDDAARQRRRNLIDLCTDVVARGRFATPGPWRAERAGQTYQLSAEHSGRLVSIGCSDNPDVHMDVELQAVYRNAAPVIALELLQRLMDEDVADR